MTLLRQGGKFAVVGATQFGLDWAVFVVSSWLGLPVAPANLLGRISGATAGFWLNGRYTFAREGLRLNWRRFIRFALIWIPLTIVSTFLITAVEQRSGLKLTWLAKPIVEAGLAVVSFFLCRHLVYR
ncbi:MAG: GtrA family protein [Xanthomonadaceae bacterium]|jgi:putative flippase GtrA|nr:GtrA family protein [Xanthomonadaceae bacterium]